MSGGAQCRLAGFVTVGVVGSGQSVHFDENDSCPLGGTLRRTERVLSSEAEPTAIGDTGECVGQVELCRSVELTAANG